MKRILCAILAAAMIFSVTACSQKTQPENGETPADTSASAEDTPASPDGETPALSNPVKMTEDGDIDMTAALAYETDFDALKAELASREVDLDNPVSLNARNNPATMEVWSYLKSFYGEKMMAAQQQMNINKHYEDKVYYNATEDLPAMKGFDFIFCTGSYFNRDMIDGAIDWAKNSGGLVTFTWHWNVPRDIDDSSKGWAFYQEDIINFDPLKATTPGTKEYEVAVHDIDFIASLLQEMESQGITVLFRPFHEASGAWFWWGLQPEDKKLIKEGTYPETYQRLYYMMFDRLENYHKLTNLIWVWNGQSKYCTVDPNAYDIAGIDFYATEEDHSPASAKYDELASYTYEGKMLALSECGYIPDPQQCKDEGKVWLYYMPWNDEFVYLNSTIDMNETAYPNPERMTNELLQEYFSNENLVSWNDLPEFSFGTHKLPEKLTIWLYEKENSLF